jgi:integrase
MATYTLIKKSTSSRPIIALNVRVNNKTEKFYPKIQIEDDREWNPKKEEIKGTGENIARSNQFLNKFKTEVEAFITKHRVEEIPISREDVKDYVGVKFFMTKPKSDKKTGSFMDYFQNQIDTLNLKVGTLKSYQVTKNHLVKYLINTEKNANPSFEEMDIKWFNDYTNYLSKNISLQSKDKHIKILKNFMKKSYVEKLHSNNDFESVKRLSRKDLRNDRYFISLTKEEVRSLYKLKLIGKERIAADIFLLGCYLGARWSDLVRLNKLKFKQTERGWTINFKQIKTKGHVGVPVLNIEAIRIMERNNWEVPVITEQEVNRLIKDVLAQNQLLCDEVEVSNSRYEGIYKRYELCSIHTSRRSFCTIEYNKGKGVPAALIMLASGHTDLKSFLLYITTPEQEMTDELFDYIHYKNS